MIIILQLIRITTAMYYRGLENSAVDCVNVTFDILYHCKNGLMAFCDIDEEFLVMVSKYDCEMKNISYYNTRTQY